MNEQERYTIEKDLVNEKLCIWDYDDLICEIDDDKTLTTLVNLLNKLHKENIKLKKENEQLKQENEVQKDTIEALTENISHFDMEEMI